MTRTPDSQYYARRLAQERALADRASDDYARRLHLELAERYARIVEPAPENDADEPRLAG